MPKVKIKIKIKTWRSTTRPRSSGQLPGPRRYQPFLRRGLTPPCCIRNLRRSRFSRDRGPPPSSPKARLRADTLSVVRTSALAGYVERYVALSRRNRAIWAAAGTIGCPAKRGERGTSAAPAQVAAAVPELRQHRGSDAAIYAADDPRSPESPKTRGAERSKVGLIACLRGTVAAFDPRSWRVRRAWEATFITTDNLHLTNKQGHGPRRRCSAGDLDGWGEAAVFAELGHRFRSELAGTAGALVKDRVESRLVG